VCVAECVTDVASVADGKKGNTGVRVAVCVAVCVL